jgi:hypothetical protein
MNTVITARSKDYDKFWQYEYYNYGKKFWEELVAYFLLIQGPYRKDVSSNSSLPRESVVRGYTNRPADPRDQTIILFLRIFVAAGTFLTSLCPAIIAWGHIQTKTDRRDL